MRAFCRIRSAVWPDGAGVCCAPAAAAMAMEPTSAVATRNDVFIIMRSRTSQERERVESVLRGVQRLAHGHRIPLVVNGLPQVAIDGHFDALIRRVGDDAYARPVRIRCVHLDDYRQLPGAQAHEVARRIDAKNLRETPH